MMPSICSPSPTCPMSWRLGSRKRTEDSSRSVMKSGRVSSPPGAGPESRSTGPPPVGGSITTWPRSGTEPAGENARPAACQHVGATCRRPAQSFGNGRPVSRWTVILREWLPDARSRNEDPVPRGCRVISSVVVSYQVRPEAVAEHVRLIEAVFTQLHAEQPDNVEYKVVRLADGVSFV